MRRPLVTSKKGAFCAALGGFRFPHRNVAPHGRRGQIPRPTPPPPYLRWEAPRHASSTIEIFVAVEDAVLRLQCLPARAPWLFLPHLSALKHQSCLPYRAARQDLPPPPPHPHRCRWSLKRTAVLGGISMTWVPCHSPARCWCFSFGINSTRA